MSVLASSIIGPMRFVVVLLRWLVVTLVVSLQRGCVAAEWEKCETVNKNRWITIQQAGLFTE